MTPGIVKRWDSLSGRLQQSFGASLQLQENELTAFCFDSSGTRFFVGDSKGNVSLFNFSSGEFLNSYICLDEPILFLHCSENTRNNDGPEKVLVAFGHSLGTLDQKCRDRNLLRKSHVHTTPISNVAVSPTLGLIASGGSDSMVALFNWDLIGGVQQKHAMPGSVTSLFFLGHMPVLLVGDHNGHVHFYYVLEDKNLIHLGTLRNTGRSADDENFDPELEQDAQVVLPWITSMVMDLVTHTLFTADSEGYLKAWPIGDSIVSPCQLVSREAPVAAIRAAFKIELLVSPTLCVRPHKSAINSLRLVPSPHDHTDMCVLTGGEDGHSYLYRAVDGVQVGSLWQGYCERDGNHSIKNHWLFTTDLAALRAKVGSSVFLVLCYCRVERKDSDLYFYHKQQQDEEKQLSVVKAAEAALKRRNDLVDGNMKVRILFLLLVVFMR